MGLLDQVLGGVMNSRGYGNQQAGGSSPLMPILMALLSGRGSQNGGPGNLLGGSMGGGSLGEMSQGAGMGMGMGGGLGSLIDMFSRAGHGGAVLGFQRGEPFSSPL